MSLPIIPTIKSVTDLLYQTADIMKILKQNQPVVVTRDNDMVAIMLSPLLYHQIACFLEEMEDKNATKRLEETIAKGGKFIDFNSFDKRQRKRLKLENV